MRRFLAAALSERAVTCAVVVALTVLAASTPVQAAPATPVCPVSAPCPPPPVYSRYFAQTGYQIDQDTFWNYFQRRGGLPTFGFPVSRTVRFQGYPTQFFQRQVMQLWPDGSVHLINLLDPAIMPYTTFNFSDFPATDSQLVAQAPIPSDPNYGAEAIAFVRAHAPDVWNGLPVKFAGTYFGTVSPQAAFPNQPVASPQVQSLLPLVQLEVWGLPTSQPAYDPTNHGFVYLRWQRGVMMFDSACNCTQGVLFADYFKSILTNSHLPVDLAQEAAGSPYLAQYAPGQPNSVARPAQLPQTDLTDAFTPENGPPVAVTSCGHVQIGGPNKAVLNGPAVAQAESCFQQAFQQCAPATLSVTWMSIDTGVIRTFAVAPSGDHCSVTDLMQPYFVPPHPAQTATFTCASVAQKPGGLLISGCGADGDLLLPAPGNLTPGPSPTKGGELER